MQLLLIRHALPLRSEPGQGSDPDLSEEGIELWIKWGDEQPPPLTAEHAEILGRIRKALADPGLVTARRGPTELLIEWQARAAGEDIVDLGMGNPDGAPAPHVIEKLCEVARNPNAHGYSASAGIKGLRKAPESTPAEASPAPAEAKVPVAA